MIKNTNKTIKEYAEAYVQAQNVYKQAVKHIEKNYVKDSELYSCGIKTAQETLQTALKPMQNNAKDTVKKDFEEARKAIKGVVAVAPSYDVLGVLPLIKEGKLTDSELQIFLDTHKNYMDHKLIYDAMGKTAEFSTVEDVMSDLDSVERMVNTCLNTFAGESIKDMSYNNALIFNGSLVDRVDTATDNFLATYGGQGSDNE